jgi:transposase-like protein
MRRQPRRRRDLVVMEQHRMQAAKLFEAGVIPAEIARQVGVQHQIVSQWRKAWRPGGRDALRSAGPVGRKRSLSSDQLQTITSGG